MIFLFGLFVNFIDFSIIKKYYSCFSKERTCKKTVSTAIFLVSVLLISLVNQLDVPTFNLITSIVLIYVYNLTFTYSRTQRVVLPILYIGFGFVAELTCYLLLSSFGDILSYGESYYVSVLLCEVLRFLIVYVIYQICGAKLPHLPGRILALLLFIPVSSIVICCVAINIIKFSQNYISSILSLIIIIMTLAINVLLLSLIRKLIDVMLENHNNAMLLQEAKAKENYYREVENSNNTIREIKHNLKNMLLAIYAKADDNQILAEEVKALVEELDESEKNIYTTNVIFNTILNNKVNQAKNQKIDVEVSVLIPQYINLDYKDAGVLLGNLLDNAMEACSILDESKRKMTISIIYRKGMLLVKVRNSKEDKRVDIDKSSKMDKDNHGIGIPSIKRIIKKYNGAIEFIDKGTEFEVCASMYGIHEGT